MCYVFFVPPFYRSSRAWAGGAQHLPAAVQSGCPAERGCGIVGPETQEANLDTWSLTGCLTPTEKKKICLLLPPVPCVRWGILSKKTPDLALRMPGDGVSPPGPKRELHYWQNFKRNTEEDLHVKWWFCSRNAQGEISGSGYYQCFYLKLALKPSLHLSLVHATKTPPFP